MPNRLSWKILSAVFGLGLLFSGIILTLQFRKDTKEAFSLDDKKTIFAALDENTPPFCVWEAKISERVMTENESKSVVIEVNNKENKTCESSISIRSPGFDITPQKDEQQISLQKNGKGSLAWILTPRKSGTYEISVSDILNTRIIGITVTNIFGLTSTQAKFFSIIGSLFGPMFTIPWWFDRFTRKRKQESVKIGESV